MTISTILSRLATVAKWLLLLVGLVLTPIWVMHLISPNEYNIMGPTHPANRWLESGPLAFCAAMILWVIQRLFKKQRAGVTANTSLNILGSHRPTFLGLTTGLVFNLFGLSLTVATYTVAGEQLAILIAFVFLSVWAVGFRIVRKQRFKVIERWGQFYRVAHAGPRFLLLPGLIDRVVMDDTLAAQEMQIYGATDSTGQTAEIDFRDGSAPVDATAWFAIASPEAKRQNDLLAINRDIIRYTYAYEKPRQRILEIVDAFMRPKLQSLTLDEAQVEQGQQEAGSFSEQLCADNNVAAAMLEIGSHFVDQKAFVLADIDIPQPLQEARAARLIATALADADAETGRGIRQALAAIKRENPQMTDEQAAQLFLHRTGFKTIEQLTGANFQFIASDVGGVVRTLGVGGDQTGVTQP